MSWIKKTTTSVLKNDNNSIYDPVVNLFKINYKISDI